MGKILKYFIKNKLNEKIIANKIQFIPVQNERFLIMTGIHKWFVVMVLKTFFTAMIFGQVNTEIMRKTDLTDGIYNNLSFSFGYIDGNSEILSIKTSYRTDWLKNRHYAFFIGNYQRATNNKMLSLNKGFVHLRYSYPVSRHFKAEIFSQKEFNEFILIKDRQLFGGGLRTELFSSDTAKDKKSKMNINAGAGLMHENEKFNKSGIQKTKFFRSTNYLSSRFYFDEKISWIGIGYYQVNLKKTNDYRILLDSGLGFNITRHFLVTTTLNFRYDNQPPPDIKKFDLELNNGLSLNF